VTNGRTRHDEPWFARAFPGAQEDHVAIHALRMNQGRRSPDAVVKGRRFLGNWRPA
jgi:hypothetical protein